MTRIQSTLRYLPIKISALVFFCCMGLQASPDSKKDAPIVLEYFVKTLKEDAEKILANGVLTDTSSKNFQELVYKIQMGSHSELYGYEVSQKYLSKENINRLIELCVKGLGSDDSKLRYSSLLAFSVLPLTDKHEQMVLKVLRKSTNTDETLGATTVFSSHGFRGFQRIVTSMLRDDDIAHVDISLLSRSLIIGKYPEIQKLVAHLVLKKNCEVHILYSFVDYMMFKEQRFAWAALFLSTERFKLNGDVLKTSVDLYKRSVAYACIEALCREKNQFLNDESIIAILKKYAVTNLQTVNSVSLRALELSEVEDSYFESLLSIKSLSKKHKSSVEKVVERIKSGKRRRIKSE